MICMTTYNQFESIAEVSMPVYGAMDELLARKRNRNGLSWELDLNVVVPGHRPADVG